MIVLFEETIEENGFLSFCDGKPQKNGKACRLAIFQKMKKSFSARKRIFSRAAAYFRIRSTSPRIFSTVWMAFPALFFMDFIFF